MYFFVSTMIFFYSRFMSPSSQEERLAETTVSVIMERQSQSREEVGVDGWANKSTNFNTGERCSFPVSY